MIFGGLSRNKDFTIVWPTELCPEDAFSKTLLTFCWTIYQHIPEDSSQLKTGMVYPSCKYSYTCQWLQLIWSPACNWFHRMFIKKKKHVKFSTCDVPTASVTMKCGVMWGCGGFLDER
jgi:hypothetical protein